MQNVNGLRDVRQEAEVVFHDQHGDTVTRREARHLRCGRGDDSGAGRGLDLDQPATVVAVDNRIEATVGRLLLEQTDVRLVEQVFENGRKAS